MVWAQSKGGGGAGGMLGGFGGSDDAMKIFGAVVAIMVLLLGGLAATTPATSDGPRGLLSALGVATRVFMKNFMPLTLMSFLVGGLGSLAAGWTGSAVHDWWLKENPTNNPQVALLSSELPSSVVVLIWGCTVGSFAAAFALYFWVRHEKGEEGSLYNAVNYALARLNRVMRAHATAYGLIWLGNIVIIPGIWFALQYAFVDAIATLDEREKDPLARSQKLTYGRRGKIFRTFAIMAIWLVPYQLPLRFAFQDLGWSWVALGGTFDQMLGFILTFTFAQYYLDLFRFAPAKAPAAPAQ